jgi:hypothetical protein
MLVSTRAREGADSRHGELCEAPAHGRGPLSDKLAMSGEHLSSRQNFLRIMGEMGRNLR